MLKLAVLLCRNVRGRYGLLRIFLCAAIYIMPMNESILDILSNRLRCTIVHVRACVHVCVPRMAHSLSILWPKY